MACLIFVFYTGRLAMPLQDMDFKARHVFFLCLNVAGLVLEKVQGKVKSDEIVCWISCLWGHKDR